MRELPWQWTTNPFPSFVLFVLFISFLVSLLTVHSGIHPTCQSYFPLFPFSYNDKGSVKGMGIMKENKGWQVFSGVNLLFLFLLGVVLLLKLKGNERKKRTKHALILIKPHHQQEKENEITPVLVWPRSWWFIPVPFVPCFPGLFYNEM